MKTLVHACLVFLFSVSASAGASGLPEPIKPGDFHSFDPAKARIGQLLFYDKILSGNRNISCGTCHHHTHHSTDGLSLGIGEGGVGLGPERTPGSGTDRVAKRIPRNAPGLWNLGHKDIELVFHDGRLSTSNLYGNGFNSPAEEWLPKGLETILAAQALFPLTAQFEMAGNTGENDVAGAVHDRIDAAWPILARRVRGIAEYRDMFMDAFDNVKTTDDITIVEIGNALAAFMGTEWANYDSPFDAYLAGDLSAMSPDAMRGMELFFGKAGCAGCHTGPLFTDHQFHALGLPGYGPGRTRRFDPYARDTGRIAESDRLEDAYRFRTPPLRNVALTGPYGHNGAYPTLEGMIRHHLDPVAARADWRPEMARLPEIPWLAAADFMVQSDKREMARQARHIDITPLSHTDTEIADLLAFLHALTGVSAEDRPLGRPDQVPSGLSVD
ncbi:MAG: cytochrome c peroxidase [Pseudomonadota bacterium]